MQDAVAQVGQQEQRRPLQNYVRRGERLSIRTHSIIAVRLDQNYSRRWVSSVDLTERLTMTTISSDASYDNHPEALCEREALRALAPPNLC